MDAVEDGDLREQKAFAVAINDLKSRLRRLLGEKAKFQNGPLSRTRLQDLDKITTQISMFSEEPQLLDPHLKDILRPLTDTFLTFALSFQNDAYISDIPTKFEGICKILYTICKVRGAKVISQFLNNEPKYIEPILHTLQSRLNTIAPATEVLDKHYSENYGDNSTSWEERYITFLWLAHLMLTPFDLDIISTQNTLHVEITSIELPAGLPEVAFRLIHMCLAVINNSGKDRDAAAMLVVTLSLRPDMQKLGLLENIVSWMLTQVSPKSDEAVNIYQKIGILTVVKSLVGRADKDIIAKHLPNIYSSMRNTMESTSTASVAIRIFAVAKRLLINVQRNVVVKLLQPSNRADSEAAKVTVRMLDTLGILEDLVDQLLTSMNDRDTQVRLAASKALSVVTLKLEPNLAEEVVEAVLASLNEDILSRKGSQDLSAVDALKWHGLTLTLGHFLFRKVPSPEQLPRVLDALCLALKFEQRSATGSQIGSNVRDAANFGFWSLARRYPTTEVMAVKLTTLRETDVAAESTSALQWIANQLVVAACLDPVGNVRRGSSAALQELIGRHPDMVDDGITLIQIVDYHSVALRARAMTEISLGAAKLSRQRQYWNALYHNLFGWRGSRAPDRVSRNLAAQAIGALCSRVVVTSIQQIIEQLNHFTSRDVEARHGLAMALASMIAQQERQLVEPGTTSYIHLLTVVDGIWSIFHRSLHFTSEDFASAAARPELLGELIVSLCGAIARFSVQLRHLHTLDDTELVTTIPDDEAISMLTLSFSTTDNAVLDAIPDTSTAILALLPYPRRSTLVSTWLQSLLKAAGVQRTRGTMMALSTASKVLPQELKMVGNEIDGLLKDVFDAIVARTKLPHAVEDRVVAIRSLSVMYETSLSGNTSYVGDNRPEEAMAQRRMLAALMEALEDYETTERGDVGSLVRLEALKAYETILQDNMNRWGRAPPLSAAVFRLALERLDKVRFQAARCVKFDERISFAILETLSDVSTYEYFSKFGQLLYQLSTEDKAMAALKDKEESLQDCIALKSAIFHGFSSSISGAADATSQAAASALSGVLATLPLDSKRGTCLAGLVEPMMSGLRDEKVKDRLAVPTLYLIAFLLDSQVLQRFVGSPLVSWRRCLSEVQKAHFKSTNLTRLLAAVDVYRGLAEIDEIRAEVLNRLFNMALHPYPKIRIAVAETLFLITGEEQLKPMDFSRQSKYFKARIQNLQQLHVKKPSKVS